MKPEIKAKWVAALRSGEYRQGMHFLRDKADRFCCLGVLCNIHAQEHPEIAQEQTNPTKYLNAQSYLPDEVINWSGVRFDGGLVTINKQLNSLSYHNDTGRTFEQIADAIEKQL